MYEIGKAAIALPIQMKPRTDQYSLSHLPFDPVQNSPPSMWKMRLNKRLGETPLRQCKPTELCAKLRE